MNRDVNCYRVKYMNFVLALVTVTTISIESICFHPIFSKAIEDKKKVKHIIRIA